MSQSMNQARKHEIGYKLFQHMLDQKGVVQLNSRMISEITSTAEQIKVPAPELILFVRSLAEEQMKTIFANT
ncbi:MAG: hypothetical protein WD512_01645 [Candidatus Paceibacterota bacterium]